VVVAASRGLQGVVEVIRGPPAPPHGRPVPLHVHQVPPHVHPAAALRVHRVAASRARRKCPPEGPHAQAAVVCRALRQNVPPAAVDQKFPVAVLRSFLRAIVPVARSDLLTGRASLGLPEARAGRNGPRNRQRVPAGLSDLPSDRASQALLAGARNGPPNRRRVPTVATGLHSCRANPVARSVHRRCLANPVALPTGLRNCPVNQAPGLHSVLARNLPSAQVAVTSEIFWESLEALRQAVPSAEHLPTVLRNFRRSGQVSANGLEPANARCVLSSVRTGASARRTAMTNGSNVWTAATTHGTSVLTSASRRVTIFSRIGTSAGTISRVRAKIGNHGATKIARTGNSIVRICGSIAVIVPRRSGTTLAISMTTSSMIAGGGHGAGVPAGWAIIQ
jgi:hypothetical protein